MAVSGTGIAPASGSVFNELTAATRRAFVPKLVVQMYFASPALYYLWGNAQRAAGGMNQVTVTLQGNSMVQGQYIGYSGGFNAPQVTPGIQAGQWNMCFWAVPVPLPFGETIIQSTETVIPILEARMNDVYAVTRQQVATNLYTQNALQNSLYPNSFKDAFDNGTNLPTYGSINRSAVGNSNFQGQYINAGAGTTWATNYNTNTAGWSRAAMSALIMKISNSAGGEAPTFGVMNPADLATTNASFIGVENQYVMPGRAYDADTPIRSSFPNINVAGVPIFADYFCPTGSMFFSNNKYTSLYISEDAAMDFSGFYSLVPLGQIGQQGVCVLGYNLISTKSSSGAWVYGFGGNSF